MTEETMTTRDAAGLVGAELDSPRPVLAKPVVTALDEDFCLTRYVF